MKNTRWSALTLFATLALAGCSDDDMSPRDPSSDAHRYASEGSVDFHEPGTSTLIEDTTSLLHPNKMRESGFELDWSAKLMQSKEIRSLFMLGDTVLLETKDHQLHAMDRHSGHYKWVIQLSNAIDFHPTLMESPISKDRFIYFMSKNQLYAIDVTRTPSGRELGVLSWKYLLPYTASTPPHANDYFVSVGCEEKNFILTMQTKETGKSSKRIKPKVVCWKRALGGRLTGTPASTGDKDDSTLMVATASGRINGLSFSTGTDIWQFPSTFSTGPVSADLLIHDNFVFAACEDHYLYCMERVSASLLGKIALDSPLVRAPWVVGHLNIAKDSEGEAIINVDNDMDILVQSKGSPIHPYGNFYHIKVKDIVEKKREKFDASDRVHVTRRWELGINWTLEGLYSYLFRTRTHFMLLKDQELVMVERNTGKVTRTIPLGNTELFIHHDVDSKTENNRLFLANRDGSVYSLRLRD
ncbi:MAG: hypothetical protein AB7F75_08420 [Planctomycetota bacterium]